MENKKILDLLEKMYVEFDSKFKQIDSRFEQIDNRFEKMEQGQKEIREDVQVLSVEVQKNRDAILKVEDVIHNKVGILFDADTRTQERVDRMDEKFSNQLGRVEAKIDVLQMETSHIRKIK